MYIAKAMLIHNKTEYKAGQEVPLKDSEAKELLADRAVVLVGDTATESKSKASKAVNEAAQLRTELAAAEKAAADEKTAREKLEAQVKELTDKLAAAEKAAKSKPQ